ncbi:recombinase family protein [Mycolicibacterium sarraceniae]|nr:recombinase family protein [Mycolicibacterium sarraceniae]
MSSIRAVVGARVSSLQGDEKTSHKTQRSKGEAYAVSQSWTVVGAFEDLDVSAIKLSPFERPDLKVWLTDRANEWDALIFAKTDRVFRSANDCVKLAEWCREHSKILVLVDDGIRLDYYHPEDAKDAFAGAMSKVFLILASVFAEIEGQRFVQRARDRVSYLRNTDRWGYGLPPYGFQVVDHPSGVGKALDHDADAQRVLHEAASRFLAGGSWTGIAHDFNNRGVLSPRDHHAARSGKSVTGSKWTVDTLRMMLMNPTTQGIKTHAPNRTPTRKRPVGTPILDADGEPVRVGPPSFDPETWERLQSEIAQRGTEPQKRRHSTNPLLGVAKCALCGKNMRQRSQTTRGGVTHRYYLCSNAPKACPKVSVIAADAEEMVEQEFLEHHAHRRVRTRVWRDGSDHSAALEQTNRTIESLREDRAMGLFSTPEDEEMFRRQMTALIAKRDELSALPIVRAGWVDAESDQTYGEVWPTATPEERRKLLTDAGVTLHVTLPNIWRIQTDLDAPLNAPHA